MYLLPDLEPWCEGQCWLSSAGVTEFACQLLAQGETNTYDRWHALLRCEPGLLLWAAAGLRWRLEEPPSLHELASWLDTQGVRSLQPEHDLPPATHAKAARVHGARTRLASEASGAVAIARAVQIIGGAESAMVQAMLRQFTFASAPRWLAACASDAKLPDDLLPEARRLAHRPDAKLPDAQNILRIARRDIIPRWQTLDREPPLGVITAMLDREQRLERRFADQLHEEKLASLKELAYGASHEINNPLANITTRAQSMLRDEDDPEKKRKLTAIVSQAYRAHEMISDMMLFAKPPNLELEPMDLVELARTSLDEVEREPECDGAELSCIAMEEEVRMIGDPRHLGETLRAICRNALEATDGRGRIEVRVGRQRDMAVVEVQDNGQGLSSRERQHLFDPFFSGREAGRGLGLGLAKAWTVVQLHHGEIEVSDGIPTRVILRLPLASPT